MGIELINTKYEKDLDMLRLEKTLKISEANLDYTNKALDLCNKDIDDIVNMLYSVRFGEGKLDKLNRGELKEMLNALYDDQDFLVNLTYEKNEYEQQVNEIKETINIRSIEE